MTEKDIAKIRKFARYVFPFDFPRKDEEIDITEKQEMKLNEFISIIDSDARKVIQWCLYALDFLSVMYEGGDFLSLDDQKSHRVITRLSTSTNKIPYVVFKILRFLALLGFWDAFGNEKVGFSIEPSDDIPRLDMSDLIEKEKKLGFVRVEWDMERIKFGKYIRGDIRVVSDVAIIGSGITAALIAERLSREDISVSVLEKGYFIDGGDVSTYLCKGTTFGGILPVLSPGITNMVLSRGVGGSTNIYFSIFERIRDEAKEIWRKFHGINTKDIFLDYATEEALKLINSRSNGKNGSPAPEFLVNLANALNAELKNFVKLEGDKSNILFGEKVFSAEKILKYAVHFGANIYLGFDVERIARSSKKWFCEGTIRDDFGNPKGRFIVESKAVFLCAGPFGNFKILSNSGFKEKALGKKLKVHPSGMIIAYFNSVQESRNYPYYIEFENIFCKELKFSPGIFPSFIPDGAKSDLVKRSKTYPFARTFIFWFNESGRSEFIRTPFGVFPRFYPTGEDISRFIFAVKELSIALLSLGAKEIILPIRFIPTISDMDSLEKLDIESIKPRQIEMISIFQTGGCPMSFSSEFGIVDSSGRVFGENSLFISDTSVMPDSAISPPLLTASALSYICVESFLGRRKA